MVLFGYTHTNRRLSRAAKSLCARALCRCGPGQRSQNGLTDEEALFLDVIFDAVGGPCPSATSSPPTRSWDPGLRTGRPVLHPQRDPARSGRRSRSTGVPNVAQWLEAGGVATVNFEEESVVERLNDLTVGQGAGESIPRGWAMEVYRHPAECLDFDLRPGEAGGDAGDRSSVRAGGDDCTLCWPAGALGAGRRNSAGSLNKIPFGMVMN